MSFDPVSYAMGKAAGGGGGGGGDVPLLSRAAWNALTTAEKQAYGLVAVQDGNSGFTRGSLYYGADYTPFIPLSVKQTGRGGSAATFSASVSGSFWMLVIALNNEATTKELNVSATLNGSGITGESIAYNTYNSSPLSTNPRNYRVMMYRLNATSGDIVSLSLSDYTGNTGIVYALFEYSDLVIDKQVTKKDANVTDSNSKNGIVVYGGFKGNTDGSISIELYASGSSVTATALASSYGSAYIFWFTDA